MGAGSSSSGLTPETLGLPESVDKAAAKAFVERVGNRAIFNETAFDAITVNGIVSRSRALEFLTIQPTSVAPDAPSAAESSESLPTTLEPDSEIHPFWAKTLCNYEAAHEDDLAVECGDSVVVVEDAGDGWYFCKVAISSGWYRRPMLSRSSYDPR